jgi:hypothetical protein
MLIILRHTAKTQLGFTTFGDTFLVIRVYIVLGLKV